MERMAKSELFTYTELSKSDFLQHQNALKPVVVPLEQSPAWGHFNQAVPGRTYLGSFKYSDENNRLVAIASAILYKDRGRSWVWIKHGPVYASIPNTKVIQKMCATLQVQFANANGAKPLFIRLSSPHKVRALVLPFEHTMYDETVVADLTKSEDELLAGMSQSGRQGVRKSSKFEVEVCEITQDRPEYFQQHCYPILEETGRRDNFGIHPLSIYQTMLETLPEVARLYVALHQGKVEAWAVTTEYSGQALYYYGASSAQARETSAAYALHWEVMKAMKARGNVVYDFMGIAGKHYPSLKNVTQFKMKFTKDIAKVPVAYDLPLQPVKYRAFALAIKTKRKLKRS